MRNVIAEFQAVFVAQLDIEKEKGSGQHLLKISHCHCPSERDWRLVSMDSSAYWPEREGGLDPRFNNY